MSTKNPKELTLGEVIKMPLYKVELVNLLREMDHAREGLMRRYDAQYAARYGHPKLKRHVTDRLRDKGLLNAESLIMLYPRVLAKDTPNLSANERTAVVNICDMALHNTLAVLNKQYENESKENLETKAN